MLALGSSVRTTAIEQTALRIDAMPLTLTNNAIGRIDPYVEHQIERIRVGKTSVLLGGVSQLGVTVPRFLVEVEEPPATCDD